MYALYFFLERFPYFLTACRGKYITVGFPTGLLGAFGLTVTIRYNHSQCSIK